MLVAIIIRPTFAIIYILPKNGMGLGPSIPSFLKNLYGQMLYLFYITDMRMRVMTATLHPVVKRPGRSKTRNFANMPRNYSHEQQADQESQDGPGGC